MEKVLVLDLDAPKLDSHNNVLALFAGVSADPAHVNPCCCEEEAVQSEAAE